MGTKQINPSEYKPENPEDLEVAIVRARFNRNITGMLLEGARSQFEEVGLPDGRVSVFHVPGAFEIPQTAQKVATNEPDGILTLGAVIRGETPHFDYICEAATGGLQEVSLQVDVPVTFGVLTCETEQQAIERARPESPRNKGAEAARSLLEMIHVFEEVKNE